MPAPRNLHSHTLWCLKTAYQFMACIAKVSVTAPYRHCSWPMSPCDALVAINLVFRSPTFPPHSAGQSQRAQGYLMLMSDTERAPPLGVFGQLRVRSQSMPGSFVARACCSKVRRAVANGLGC